MNAEMIKSMLAESPTDVSTEKSLKKIRRAMPVPNDFQIIWAEIQQYHNHPAGIVLTMEGIIYKAPKSVVAENNKRIKKEEKEDPKKKLQKFKYQFIPWEYFDPCEYSFIRNTEKECWTLSITGESEILTAFYSNELYSFFDVLQQTRKNEIIIEEALYNASIEAGDLENVAFHAAYGEDNSPNGGHGIYAEEAGALLDKLHGEESTVVGRDNAKNGPDKLVNGAPVQCKYHKTAGSSVGSCFKKIDGKQQYRYIDQNGSPMMVEVPKDQYEKAVEAMRKRITNGEVPGVTNPDEATKIVRKGKLTYQQTKNLAKAGTIESLTYDAATGAISCASIAGISALVMFSITYWQKKDIKTASKAALQSGLQVFGPAFAGRMLASQIARTGLPKALIPVTDQISKLLGPKTVQRIINAFRTLAGKKPIYGAAAQKSFAKALRTTVLTETILFVVTSVPDTVRLINGKLTGAQYTKNLLSALSGILGAAIGGGATGALIADKLPNNKLATKALGVLGGAIGGIGLGLVSKVITDAIWEDDAVFITRIINSAVEIECIEYVLSSEEVDILIEELNENYKELTKLQKNLIKSKHQYADTLEFIHPIFDKIVSKRQAIDNEMEQKMILGMDQLLVDLIDDQSIIQDNNDE